MYMNTVKVTKNTSLNYPGSDINNLTHITVWIYIYMFAFLDRHNEQKLAFELQKVYTPVHQKIFFVEYMLYIYIYIHKVQ